MKRLSRRKLIRKIGEMYEFLSDCEEADRAYGRNAKSDLAQNNYFRRADAFNFIRNYLLNHFRPLV